MAHMDDELDDNPVLVQSFRKRASSPHRPTPLVLFHDGGGTPFNYFLLKPLGRDVFGFADPRAPVQQPWSGGVDEMARYYLECMTTAVTPGPVLLGGWSFGGILAVQVAHLIAKGGQEAKFSVAGIVLIDTTFPPSLNYADPQHSEHRIPFKDDVPEHMRQVAQTSMNRAVRMMSQWVPPIWPGRAPPTLLLRATEAVNDRIERGPKLGWELYANDFVHGVFSVPGNHFTLFDGPNVSSLSEQLGAGCQMLDARMVNAVRSDTESKN